MFDHIIPTTTTADAQTALTIHAVTPAGFGKWLESQSDIHKSWIEANRFEGKRGTSLLLPSNDGKAASVVLGFENDAKSVWDFAALVSALPKGTYQFDATVTSDDELCERAMLGLYLGGYRFDRYRKIDAPQASFVRPANKAADRAENTARGIALTRDLINVPANDMGPVELAAAAQTLADEFSATITTIVGDDLETQNYPSIYAVGKGSDRAPRLIDMHWGDENAPRVTLVGKGVCFDTGGYDLKPASNMLLMKKDMGGAAQVLGLARMIMAAQLPVRLRVLIPAVENMVSGNAFRPSDIINTRKGVTVEVGNTDAEGRLVLSDALTEAASEDPEILLDFATLTGAARVALGLGLPALFSNNDDLANALQNTGIEMGDPMWRLPLWDDYRPMLESKIADTNNISSGPFGGAIIAALFLDRFAKGAKAWAHIDLMAWNPAGTPGRPEGGEAQGIRAAFKVISDRYGK
ncbi:leucyl aminopeptidase family protein [Thalassospira mesophila]|uniref:Cytochrome c oxidase subunit II n=1 Tax=Thalassospira mesophila TaxID=1293891 RepID=A0A1Y2L4M0_9PROT|nr:leucyl aminopeptidase family protein [Thalassospira mesophila]OSQ40621.1 cytochrome c oxidase subunit II [Thalassospira mesophila]